MIIEQYPYIDEYGNERNNLIKYYSDEGYMIRQIETGYVYGEAVDIYPSKYTYEETDEKIIISEPKTELEPEEDAE